MRLRDWLSAQFELQAPDTARWLPMEGLRGFAVFLVFIVHYTSLVKPLIGTAEATRLLARTLHETGNAGVDLFFVLSGFLIYRACLQRPVALRDYAYRRIERIYPTFLAVFAIYLVPTIALPGSEKLGGPLGHQLVYILQNVLLLPGMLDIMPIIAVAWSLSFEAFYYIIVPLAVIGLSLRQWSAVQRIALILFIYATMILAAWEGWMGGLFRLSMFTGGILLYEVSHNIKWTPPRWLPQGGLDVLSLLLVLFGLAAFSIIGGNRWLIRGTIFEGTPGFVKFIILNFVFALLVYRCLFRDGPAARLFSWTPLRWLGNMSYSYYLFHGLAVQAFFMALVPIWPGALNGSAVYAVLLVPAFAASVVLSAPLFLLIERPFSLKKAKRPARAQREAV